MRSDLMTRIMDVSHVAGVGPVVDAVVIISIHEEGGLDALRIEVTD